MTSAADFGEIRMATPASSVSKKVEPGNVQGNDMHRRKLSPEAVQKIFGQLENMPVSKIAARWGVSVSTIRRIQEEGKA